MGKGRFGGRLGPEVHTNGSHARRRDSRNPIHRDARGIQRLELKYAAAASTLLVFETMLAVDPPRTTNPATRPKAPTREAADLGKVRGCSDVLGHHPGDGHRIQTSDSTPSENLTNLAVAQDI
jgi:hypothetical protein